MRIIVFGLAVALSCGSVMAGESWREAPAGVPGAVLVTSAGPGEVTFDCVGYADVKARRKMTPDTVFWMASNTKGVAAATVLSVVMDGKLDLDDPVEKYFPSWKKLEAKTRPTLRMLLAHTAGLDVFTDRPLPRPGMEALAERAAEQPLKYEPGTKYLYSNWDIDVAVAMVEKVTGRPFDVEMRERIFKPLGMTDTTFVPNADQKARRAIPYKLSDKAEPRPTEFVRTKLAKPYMNVGEHPEAGGGLLSTPRDMIKFFRMIADGGKSADGKVIVSPELMQVWTTRQTPKSLKTSYSLGMQVSGDGRLSHGGAAGTWCEASMKSGRARLFLINFDGENKALKAFRSEWMKKTSK